MGVEVGEFFSQGCEVGTVLVAFLVGHGVVEAVDGGVEVLMPFWGGKVPVGPWFWFGAGPPSWSNLGMPRGGWEVGGFGRVALCGRSYEGGLGPASAIGVLGVASWVNGFGGGGPGLLGGPFSPLGGGGGPAVWSVGGVQE